MRPLRRRRQIEASMKKYPASPDKIVLGLPWYAYDFVCAEGTAPAARNCNATADYEGHFSYFGALQVLRKDVVLQLKYQLVGNLHWLTMINLNCMMRSSALTSSQSNATQYA